MESMAACRSGFFPSCTHRQSQDNSSQDRVSAPISRYPQHLNSDNHGKERKWKSQHLEHQPIHPSRPSTPLTTLAQSLQRQASRQYSVSRKQSQYLSEDYVTFRTVSVSATNRRREAILWVVHLETAAALAVTGDGLAGGVQRRGRRGRRGHHFLRGIQKDRSINKDAMCVESSES